MNRQFTNHENRLTIIENELHGPNAHTKVISHTDIPANTPLTLNYIGPVYTINGNLTSLGSTNDIFINNFRLNIFRNGQRRYKTDHIIWIDEFTFKCTFDLVPNDILSFIESPIMSDGNLSLASLAARIEEIGKEGIRAWLQGTLYIINNIISFDDGTETKIYKCVSQHTSSTDFNNDLTNWVLVSTTGLNSTVNDINAKYLNYQIAAYYLDRTNHTGTINRSAINDINIADGVAGR